MVNEYVEIILQGKNIKYYEELGYEIPRYLDNKGRNSIKRGTKIPVLNLSGGDLN